MPTPYRMLDDREPQYTENLATHQPTRRRYTQAYPQQERVVVQQLAPGMHFSVFAWILYTLLCVAIGAAIGFVVCFLYIANLRAGG